MMLACRRDGATADGRLVQVIVRLEDIRTGPVHPTHTGGRRLVAVRSARAGIVLGIGAGRSVPRSKAEVAIPTIIRSLGRQTDQNGACPLLLPNCQRVPPEVHSMPRCLTRRPTTHPRSESLGAQIKRGGQPAGLEHGLEGWARDAFTPAKREAHSPIRGRPCVPGSRSRLLSVAMNTHAAWPELRNLTVKTVQLRHGTIRSIIEVGAHRLTSPRPYCALSKVTAQPSFENGCRSARRAQIRSSSRGERVLVRYGSANEPSY